MLLDNILFFVFGLILGSFINVIIQRIPKGISIIRPRSFCFLCKYKIPFYRNIPLFSYLIQRGKCSNCNENISHQYIVIEFLIGILWLYSSFVFNNFYVIINFSMISSFLIAITVIDYKHFIIPIEITTFIFLFLSLEYFFDKSILLNLQGAFVGSIYLLLILLITWLITKRQGLGYGDIQLIFVLGYWLGIYKILFVIFFSALSAIIFWLILNYLKEYDKNRALPFGSFLCINSIIFYQIEINYLFRF